MKSKIFEVADGHAVYLVKATTVNQAIRFICDKTISARIASQDRLVQLVQEGTAVLDATVTDDVKDAHFPEVGDTLDLRTCTDPQPTTINTGEEIF